MTPHRVVAMAASTTAVCGLYFDVAGRDLWLVTHLYVLMGALFALAAYLRVGEKS